MKRADELRGRARHGAHEARDKAASSPGAMGAIGALAGAALGMSMAKKARDKQRESRHYDYGGGFRTEGSYVSRDYLAQPAYVPRPDYSAAPDVSPYGGERWSEPYRSESAERSWENAEPYGAYGAEPYDAGTAGGEPSRGDQMKQRGAEMKGKATERAAEMKGKAHEMKDRLSHKAADLKHQASDRAHQMRDKRQQGGGGSDRMQRMRSQASHLRERIPSGGELRHQAQERPMGAILGGVALGILAASLVPLSRKERKVMHPAKERARHQLDDQVHHLQDQVKSKLGMGDSHAEPESRSEQPSSSQPSGWAAGAATGAAASSSTTEPERELASREDFGLTGNEEPYRQPSVGEQMEDPNIDPDNLH